jgi:asparaginyl-tRNA synthetase
MLKLPLCHLTEQSRRWKSKYKEDFFGKKPILPYLDNWKVKLSLHWVRFIHLGQRLEQRILILRHLAEFWMIEPEVAFNDLNDNMDLAEDFIQYVINMFWINVLKT